MASSFPLVEFFRFQCSTQLSKVETEFGRVFEFIMGRYLNWRSI